MLETNLLAMGNYKRKVDVPVRAMRPHDSAEVQLYSFLTCKSDGASD